MTRRLLRLLPGALLATAFVLTAAPSQAADHSFGIGAISWQTIDGLPTSSELDNIEEDGYSWLVSYQYRPRGLFTFELAVEYYPDGYGGATEKAYVPQAFLLFGRGLYAGVGAGVTISDGLDDSPSDAFYQGRLGYNLAFLGPIELDLHATYRFDDWDALEDIDVETDSYLLGATVRF